MTRALLLATLIVAPPTDRWFGVDKVKHFMISAFVQSAAFSAARAAGVNRPNAQLLAGVSTAVVGIGREVYDRRQGKVFSVKDLTWDAAGGLAAAAILNGTR